MNKHDTDRKNLKFIYFISQKRFFIKSRIPVNFFKISKKMDDKKVVNAMQSI